MKKSIALSIGILLVAAMGFVSALNIPTIGVFKVQNRTTGAIVAWIDGIGNMNITGSLDVDLNKFVGAGTLGLGNITDPTDCTAGNYAYGKTAGALDCRADQTGNTSAQIIAVVPANTTAQIWATIDNQTYHKLSVGNLNIANMTNPTNCTTGNYVQGLNNGAWVCTADISSGVDSYVNTTGDKITGNITVNTNTGFTNTTAAILYDGNNGWIVILG